MFKQRILSAFSLIELLVVIAIIGILLVIGIPAYNNYIIKAKIIDIFAIADLHKLKLLENILNNPNINSIDDNYVIDHPSKLVARLEHSINRQEQKYAIKMVANMLNLGLKQIENQPLIIEFVANQEDSNGIITWNCQYNKGYAEVMPKNCKQVE